MAESWRTNHSGIQKKSMKREEHFKPIEYCKNESVLNIRATRFPALHLACQVLCFDCLPLAELCACFLHVCVVEHYVGPCCVCCNVTWCRRRVCLCIFLEGDTCHGSKNQEHGQVATRRVLSTIPQLLIPCLDCLHSFARSIHPLIYPIYSFVCRDEVVSWSMWA